MINKKGIISTLSATLFSILAGVQTSSAQSNEPNMLEEVVVTAQRREQSLRDVPISIDVVSGASIDKQGYTFLRDMTAFTPGIIIKNDYEEQGMTVRGSGSTGKNISTEQAAPIFVDGIYFGMASQTMNAFLDTERVEILKGPQPVYFGQSATAGAIAITTKKPGLEWEGRAVLEYASGNSQRIEFGIGGPITDTLGIRVAAKLKQSDGYMEDILTAERFPFTQEKGMRGILQWRPTDNFNATLKVEVAEQDMGPRAAAIACGKNPVSTHTGMSILVYGLEGLKFEPVDCSVPGNFTNRGFKSSSFAIAPPVHVDAAGSPNTRRGILDLTGLGPGDLGPIDDPMYRGLPPTEWLNGDFSENTSSDPWNTLLNLSYTLNNGLELTSLTGFNRLTYQTIQNSTGPIYAEPRRKYVDYNSWSQEFRLASPVGGVFEWMLGTYLQITEIDINAENWRAEPATAFRSSANGEDDEYRNIFATVTYNFLDDKASLDVGARYSDIRKLAWAVNYQAQWIVEHPVTGNPFEVPRVNNIVALGLHAAKAIGRTPFYVVGERSGDISESKINPQLVLRYRANSDLSFYAKWATGFKSGAFEMGQPQPPEAGYQFDAENAEIWETGARSTFWDGRASADLTLFWTNYEGLQVTAVQTINGVTTGRTTNAAKQRNRGAELSGRVMLTDRTSLGYSAMYLDSVMLDFTTAVCSEAEGQLGLCGPNNTIDRSGERSYMAPAWQASLQLNHWIPVLDRYKVSLNANFIASDDYIIDRNWSRVVTMHPSEDLNLSLGYGDQNDVWEVSAWARNILESQPTYNAEYDVSGDGLLEQYMHSSNFMSYGLQLRYSY